MCLKLKAKQKEEIDAIIRKHLDDWYIICTWIGYRDKMKEIRKEADIRDIRSFLSIVSEDERSVIDRLIMFRNRLEDVEACLRNRVKKLRDSADITKLTRKQGIKGVRKWPVFTNIMKDLYKYLLPKFQEKPPRGQIPIEGRAYVKDPREVYEVISGLLQEYFPTYFKNYKWENVKSRCQEND